MRIVHALGWYFPDSLGGTEVYVQGVAKRMSRLGHQIMVAAPQQGITGPRDYEHNGLQVYRFPIPQSISRPELRGQRPVRGVEHFHQWLRECDPTVIHFHTFVPGLGLDELRVAKEVADKVIATTHYPSLGWLCQRGTMLRWGQQLCDGQCIPTKCAACDLQNRGLRPRLLAATLSRLPVPVSSVAMHLPGRTGGALGMPAVIARNLSWQNQMLRLVDAFVVLTKWAKQVVIANGAPSEKIVLNRLGHSMESVAPKPPADEEPTEVPIKLGFLGRVDPVKGVDVLLEAFRGLPRELPLELEIRGPVAGGRDSPYYRKLQKLAGNDPRICFADPVPPEETPALLASYDILCCPSLWLEGGPTVAIEAHAVGTPVIGTPMGGLAELVSDGVNGRLFPPRDVTALRETFRTVAARPETVDDWRRQIPQTRTIDDVTADYLKLYAA